MALPIDVGRRSSSSGGRYVERKASVSPYIRKILVVGRAWRKTFRTAWGIAPPVLVIYRRLVSGCFCRVELGWASKLQSVGTPARPVIRSFKSIWTTSRAKTKLINTIVLPAMTLAWLSITPLGLPVDPEV